MGQALFWVLPWEYYQHLIGRLRRLPSLMWVSPIQLAEAYIKQKGLPPLNRKSFLTVSELGEPFGLILKP